MTFCLALCCAGLLFSATAARAETAYVSPWEFSVGAGVRQFDLHVHVKPTASFQTTPLTSSEKQTAVYPSIELRRILTQSDTMTIRLGFGYNFASADWDSGEHEAGEAPGEIYALDISKFDLNADLSHVTPPKPADAPSNLIITGRYILQQEIFGILDKQKAGTGGEIQLTDAMKELAKQQPFYGLKFDGRSFDCGSKIGFLAANIAYALERKDLGPALRAELPKLLGGK